MLKRGITFSASWPLYLVENYGKIYEQRDRTLCGRVRENTPVPTGEGWHGLLARPDGGVGRTARYSPLSAESAFSRV